VAAAVERRRQPGGAVPAQIAVAVETEIREAEAAFMRARVSATETERRMIWPARSARFG